MLSSLSLENKECLLTGDINCNYLVDSDHKELKSFLAFFGLRQLITVTPTRIAQKPQTLIDVLCSNEPHNIYFTKTILAGLSDHELIGCARKVYNAKFKPRVITCRNYSNHNPQLFCDDLRSRLSECFLLLGPFLRTFLKNASTNMRLS